jgi:hypothetical protein
MGTRRRVGWEIPPLNHILLPRPFMNTLLVRVLVLWLFLHGFSRLGASVQPGDPAVESWVGALMSITLQISLVVLVMRVEMGRKAEIIFLANLGYSFRGVALLVCCECLVLEGGLRLAGV